MRLNAADVHLLLTHDRCTHIWADWINQWDSEMKYIFILFLTQRSKPVCCSFSIVNSPTTYSPPDLQPPDVVMKTSMLHLLVHSDKAELVQTAGRKAAASRQIIIFNSMIEGLVVKMIRRGVIVIISEGSGNWQPHKGYVIIQ